MSGSFALWRAGMALNALFAAGVAAVVLVLLGGTTWATDGICAADGAYWQFVSTVIGIAWLLMMCRVLLKSDFRRDSDLFGEGVRNPDAQERIQAAIKRGFQTREAEMSLGRLLGDLTGR